MLSCVHSSLNDCWWENGPCFTKLQFTHCFSVCFTVYNCVQWGRCEEGVGLRFLLGAWGELMMGCRGLTVLEFNSVWSEFVLQKWQAPGQWGEKAAQDGRVVFIRLFPERVVDSSPCLKPVAKWKMDVILLSSCSLPAAALSLILLCVQSWASNKGRPVVRLSLDLSLPGTWF